MNWCVILFPSSSYAIYGQKTLKRQSIQTKLIPVPRLLSSSCGVCIRINTDNKQQSEKALIEKGILFERIVEI
jgi:hypothetical protein